MSASCVALMMLQIYDCVGVSGNNLPKLFIYSHTRKEYGSASTVSVLAFNLQLTLNLTRSANSRW